MTELEVKLIKLDGGTQARAKTDRDTVTEYAEALRESDSTWPFPPVVVYYDGNAYWLADGFHRLAAARQHGRFVCEADIRQGTQRDAILHAAGANAEHGLRRTAEDKRRAALRLLEDAEWGKWSDREIARRCRVSPTFVGNIRKELGDTVHVDSERIYTRNGEERVMDTANIGGDPRPEITTVPEREKIVQNVSRELVRAVRETYSADLIMGGKCKKPFEYNGELYVCTGGYGGGPHSKNDEEVVWAVRVVPEADFEFRPITYSESCLRPERASYYGVKVKHGRDTYVFVYPELRFVSTKSSPFYVGPMAQGPEVREALGRYLDQWPANRDFIIMRLANVEASGHEKEMSDAVAALGASNSAIYHQAMVLRNNLPKPSWERAETAVSHPTPDQIEGLVTRAANDVIDDGDLADYAALYSRWLDDGPDDPDWHHLEKRTTGIPHGLIADALRSCYRRVATEETAVSPPPDLMTDIMADVDAYEAEAAQLFTAAPAPRRADYIDPRLAELNNAIALVTRLTADTSLTIDIVGPLARALGLMEDAKKALTKRQKYAAWLRDYQDDDGRCWTDLSDNQTWHKNVSK